jgi:hypothetical protein
MIRASAFTMTLPKRLWLAPVVLFALASLAPASPVPRAARAATPATAPPAARPATPPPFMEDKGKFRVVVSGQEVGKEEFEFKQRGAEWVDQDTSEIKTPDGTTRVTGTLELRTDGTPVHYEWSTEGSKKAAASIDFRGPTATINLRVAGRQPFTQQFTYKSPQIVVLDNNLYHQYAVLAYLYDWNKKGPQTFAVLVPQSMTPGSVTVESLGKQTVDGKELDELSVKTEDLELDLYLENQRLMRIVAPSSSAAIIRE